MAIYQRILVPTDFSPPSVAAARTALALAAHIGAEVTLLHVVEASFDYDFHGIEPALIQRIHGERRAAAERAMEKLKAQLGAKPPLRGEIRDGIPSQQVLAFAAEIKADLIVMGTRGNTGIKHLLLGSTAERVVRGATCAVLTTRDEK